MSAPESEEMVAFEGIIGRNLLRNYLDTYLSIVDEAKLEFSSDGVYAQPVDASNAAMVNQTLAPAAFESFESVDFEIGIDLGRLDGYLKKGKSDLVEITFSNEDRKFHLQMGEVSASIAGIDPDSVRQGQTPPDELDLPTDVQLPGDALEHAVDVAEMVSDHVAVECDPDRDRPLHFIGEGDTDDVRVRFGDSLEEGSKVPEQCTSLFTAQFLLDFASVIPSDASVRLQSGEELPMTLNYSYGDGNAEVEMMLAPRIATR